METKALGRALFAVGAIIIAITLVISGILHMFTSVQDDTLFLIGCFAAIGFAMMFLSIIIAMFNSDL